jgi:acyl-CoA hydrolase
MEGKPVRESASEYADLALPNDANGLGHVLGGKVMHLWTWRALWRRCGMRAGPW